MIPGLFALLLLGWLLLRLRRARKARSAVATGAAAMALGQALIDDTRHRTPGRSRFRGSGGSM